MFESKKQSLFGRVPSTSVETPREVVRTEIASVEPENDSRITESANGALKYTTTGSDFVDQFGKLTAYRALRTYDSISSDMNKIWSQNKLLTLALTFYIRMITRIVCFFDGTKTSSVQRGQGLKHEGIMRMIWLATNAPETFWKNIKLMIAVGSWKDIIMMLSYDLQYHGWHERVLDWDKFGQLILAGLENPNTSELVKKYLPQIKTRSACKTVESQADTMIGKWICSLLFGSREDENGSTYKLYRKLKTSGTAHDWQKFISQCKFLQINFDTVHGRALAQLVSGKFLANNHLEGKYEEWLASKPVAKYTGYVYELLAPVKIGYLNADLKSYQKNTINKQFEGLIALAKQGMTTDSTLLVVVDTSSSMTSEVPGTKVSSYSVAKAMALYFGYLLTGTFHKSWMEFNDRAGLKYWQGETPVECLQNDRSEAYGSTNFQTVGKTFVDLLQGGLTEDKFPKGILCISDGEFNSVASGETNFNELKKNLLRGGFSEDYVNNFKVVLWDIPNGYYGRNVRPGFEAPADCPNFFHISGLDGSGIAFITGTEHQVSVPKTSQELFMVAMDQEVLNMLEV